MTMLVIGIGNPILSDDAVGIRVAKLLRKKLADRKDVSIDEASTGGLYLVEIMLDYVKVILIDAIKTKYGNVGDIYRMTPEDFKETVHSSSIHDVTFIQALELWSNICADKIPKEIIIYAIEVDNINSFSERLSPRIEKAVPKVVDLILKEINGQ